MLAARRIGPLEELAADLRSQHGVRVESIPIDISDADARRALPGRLQDLGLTLDVLVNNAGFGTSGAVAKGDEERAIAMIRTNVEAVASLCSLFVPGMVARRQGAILNVASTAAFQPLPGQAGYAASKAFVLSYSEALRTEVAGSGVSVTVLCPGPVETEFSSVAGIADNEAHTLPRFMWVSAVDVARAAVEGLDRGRAVVIPGVANRVAASAAAHTPRRLLMPMIARTSPLAKR